MQGKSSHTWAWKYGALVAIGVVLVYFSEAWALVEYSENSTMLKNSLSASSGPSSAGSPSNMGSTQRDSGVDRLGEKMFSFQSGFLSTNIDVGEKSGRIDTFAFDARVDTPYQIWGQASYWLASSQNQDIATDSSQQGGNPDLRLGLNWLNIGPAAYAARVDIYGGVSLAAKDSEFGSTRTDKIVGLSTSKRFERFVAGLGGELVLTGSPDIEQEMKIGNITKLSGLLGLVVSDDIRLAFEAATYKILDGDEDKSNPNRLRLMDPISFSVLSPRIMLGLASMVELSIGAHLRTKNPSSDVEQNLLQARIFQIPGAYGNAVTAGLGFSL